MIYLAFACSGAAALIYEISWTRLLTLFMGHTVAAASTVLAAFMGGLAVGAAVAGRLASRLDRPSALRAYAAVEVLIAAFAIVLPLELKLFRPMLAAAYADGDGHTLFGFTRFICALLVVTAPAVAMGATLPLLVRWAAGSAARAGRDTGLLYAANTIGAAAGAVLCGFVLLPSIGIRETTYVAVALNAISAAIAWHLAKSTKEAVPRPTRKRTRVAASSSDAVPAGVVAPGMAIVAVGISGCVSLVLQVVWTRILALVIGPTTYAFSAMVATFITGIALGSMIGGRLSGHRRRLLYLTASLLVAGIAAAVAAAWAPVIPLTIANAVAAPDASFTAIVRLQSALIAALMMPMTLAFGAAFPLAAALAARQDATVSRDVAFVYTANTIGAIAGALLGGFVLIPLLGLQDTVKAAACLAIAGGAAIAAWQSSQRFARIGTFSLAAAAVALVVAMPAWDRELLSSGAYKYAPYMEGPHRDALLRAGRLLYYREGGAGTVSVRKLTGALSLAIDGKVDASNGGDMLTQRLLAHVPLLLHPAPRSVAIIGLGSGVTLGSALLHPIERADILEISPEVVEASRFFERENHRALDDRRTRLIVGDGRSHLALARRPYDVIISEPSNPWMAGVAALFTQEFFEAAKARLAPAGIVCQWAHTYDISDADLRSIVATFTSVFQHATLWLSGDGDVLLVGSLTPIEPRLAEMRTAWTRSGVAGDLAGVSVDDADTLLTLFVAGAPRLNTYAQGAAIQRDDEMRLEFSGPRGIYGRSTLDNAATLRRLSAGGPMPAAVRVAWDASATPAHRGAMHLRAEAFGTAFEDFTRALETDPGNRAAAEGLLRAAAGTRRISEAEALLERLAARDPDNVALATTLSRLNAARGDFSTAAGRLRPLFGNGKPDRGAIEQLASVFADAGDAESLAVVVEDLQRIAPGSEPALYYAAALHFIRNQPLEAIAAAERLCPDKSRHARCLNLLGAAYAAVGRNDAARRAFEASIDADPSDPVTYVNLGRFELQAGRSADAENYFAQALTLDASSTAAQDGLAEAIAASGRH